MKNKEQNGSGANFSNCRRYRWDLWRCWDNESPKCVFIGLNPSTADETQNDPTVTRCIQFAKRLGMGGLIMLNTYAYRATKPADMIAQADPIGTGNAKALKKNSQHAFDNGGIIIAAWGSHCSEERERAVCKLINRQIYCLGKTKHGRPRHPLYLRSDTKLEVFWQPAK